MRFRVTTEDCGPPPSRFGCRCILAIDVSCRAVNLKAVNVLEDIDRASKPLIVNVSGPKLSTSVNAFVQSLKQDLHILSLNKSSPTSPPKTTFSENQEESEEEDGSERNSQGNTGIQDNEGIPAKSKGKERHVYMTAVDQPLPPKELPPVTARHIEFTNSSPKQSLTDHPHDSYKLESPSPPAINQPTTAQNHHHQRLHTDFSRSFPRKTQVQQRKDTLPLRDGDNFSLASPLLSSQLEPVSADELGDETASPKSQRSSSLRVTSDQDYEKGRETPNPIEDSYSRLGVERLRRKLEAAAQAKTSPPAALTKFLSPTGELSQNDLKEELPPKPFSHVVPTSKSNSDFSPPKPFSYLHSTAVADQVDSDKKTSQAESQRPPPNRQSLRPPNPDDNVQRGNNIHLRRMGSNAKVCRLSTVPEEDHKGSERQEDQITDTQALLAETESCRVEGRCGGFCSPFRRFFNRVFTRKPPAEMDDDDDFDLSNLNGEYCKFTVVDDDLDDTAAGSRPTSGHVRRSHTA